MTWHFDVHRSCTLLGGQGRDDISFGGSVLGVAPIAAARVGSLAAWQHDYDGDAPPPQPPIPSLPPPPPSSTPPLPLSSPPPPPPATTRDSLAPATVAITSHHRWHHFDQLGRCHGCWLCWIHRRRPSSSNFVYGAALIHLSACTCPLSHICLIDSCVRRLCYVHRPEQDLMLLPDWLVAARPVEDAAGGR